MSAAQGAALLAGGRFHEAVAAFAQALRQEPDSLPLRIGLARACAGAGDALAAAAWLSDACRIAPAAVEPAQLLADLLMRQRLYAQAAPVFERLVRELGARTPANLLHAGFCREHSGDVDAAIAWYREALASRDGFMEAHVDLAGVLWRVGDFDGALAHAQQAVALAPGHPFAVRMLGTVLLNLNRLEEAEHHLRRALELQPGLPIAELDLAFCLLAAGRLAEGWRWYERRWRDTHRVRRPVFFRPEHEWQGPEAQSLAGLAIAVYAEQGLGDVLQFVRYLPRLQALAAQVYGVVQQELVPLLAESFPGITFFAGGRDVTVHKHVALLELPLRFRTDTLEAIPAEVPYLRAPDAARERWRERLAPWAGRRKVGIAWSGSQAQANNRNRAMPLSLLLPLAQQPGVQLFSLQKGDAGPFSDVPLPPQVPDLTPQWADFTDSAAMLEQLDLVITVDTAIAHLAGALGRPVWVLLAPNADWRWLVDREDSPWYPTARLFRRGFGEPREAQATRVAQALAEWCAAPQEPARSRASD